MKKTIYALIVGINNYPTSKLRGCINDALDVKDFLDDLNRNNDSIESIQYKFLLSPLKEDLKDLEAAGLSAGTYDAPTRSNIIQGFDHFKNAKPENGDSCLFYYIGHGSFQLAPRQFWHLKSARQLETIVCEDSRQYGGKDLVDKEIGYLIWNLMKDKEDMHFLAIMDSCHSGDNTRSDNPNIKAREDNPNRNSLRLEELIGFKTEGDLDKKNPDNFYFYSDVTKENLGTRMGRHVQIAAALENQSAKELSINGKRRGIFTYSLFKTLRNGGTNLSYNELIARINDYIKNHVNYQNATSLSTNPDDKELKFLGEKAGYSSPKEEFGVVFSEKGSRKEWKLLAGNIHGIVASAKGVKSLVRIIDGDKNDRVVEIKEVWDDFAILDASGFDESDQHKTWSATIESMPRPKTKVGFAKDFEKESKAKIQRQYAASPDERNFFEISENDFAYEIHEEKGHYYLTRLGENAPLFKRQNDLESFLIALDKIGKWEFLLQLGEENESTLSRRNIDIEVSVFEGERIGVDVWRDLKPSRVLENPKEINLSYVEQENRKGKIYQRQPAITIKVSCPSRKISYQAFVMSNEFGITPLESRSDFITKDGEPEYIEYHHKDISLKDPLIYYSLNKNYLNKGVTEIRGYLKFFISENPIQLNYKQKGLPIDDYFDRDRSNEKEEVEEDLDNWLAFSIPVNIKRPLRSEMIEKTIDADESELVAGVRLEVPKGFSAKVSLASEKNIKEAMQGLEAETRSLSDGQQANLNAALLPPSHIWWNYGSDSHVITSRAASASADSNLSVLEMEVMEGADTIDEDNHLVLKTSTSLKRDESIIPFAFDEESGLYLPFGYTNENGDIIINHIPKPTDGKIYSEGTINTRSIGRSVKLFLKKIIWSPRDLNQLKKVILVNDEIQSTKLEEGELAKETTGEIALLIHGIIGSTEGQVNGLFRKTELHQKFGTILTYDYENLGTDITGIAKDLKEKLQDAGLFDATNKKLTIIAHSMGGLVTRYFIEDQELDGAKVVKKLIQLGTPNGGSEISDVRKFLASALAWGMNGLAPIKPYMPAITFFAKFVGSRVFKTLNQMSPTKSDFIKDLGKSNRPAEIPYFIIGGDTSKIDSGYMEDDPFWTQLRKAMKNKGKYAVLDKFVFPTKNDMAVTINSMGTISGFVQENMVEIPGDHITYFENEQALKYLEKYIDA